MFENKFNTSKTDSLVEAVKQAQADGELRRQAESVVNEEFGVFSRKAVVREQLAAYDARLEEAYKCMKEGGSVELGPVHGRSVSKDGDTTSVFRGSYGEKNGQSTSIGKKMTSTPMGGGSEKVTSDTQITKSKATTNESKLAKKDYDKDGKVESPKDEVWGSRLRAAKKAGKLKEEEQIDEISDALKARYYKKAEKGSSVKVDNKTVGKVYYDPTKSKKFGRWSGNVSRSDGFEGADSRHDAKRAVRADAGHDSRFTKEETDYSAQDRAPVTKTAPKEDPSTPKSYPGAASTVKGPNPTSQRMQNAIRPKLQEAISRKKDIAKGGVSAPQEFKQGRFANKGAVTKAPVPGASILEDNVEEAVYSAKAARAGKDIGKPGKQFSKIAKKAGAKYGSEEKGKKVAGAILAKIRAKHMKESSLDEVVAAADLAKSGLTLGQYMNKQQGKTAVKGGRNDPSSANFAGPKSSASPATNTPGTQGVATGKSFADIDRRKMTATATDDMAAKATAKSFFKPGADPNAPKNVPSSTAASMPAAERSSIPTPPTAADAKKAGLPPTRPASLKEEVQVGDYSYKVI